MSFVFLISFSVRLPVNRSEARSKSQDLLPHNQGFYPYEILLQDEFSLPKQSQTFKMDLDFWDCFGREKQLFKASLT